MLKLALRACDAERQLGAQRLRTDGLRLGTVGAQRTGPLGDSCPHSTFHMHGLMFMCCGT